VSKRLTAFCELPLMIMARRRGDDGRDMLPLVLLAHVSPRGTERGSSPHKKRFALDTSILFECFSK
jgi:hypothetical protein